MNKNRISGIIIVLLVAIFMVYASDTALAADPTPPPIPPDPDATPTPAPSGGGGGGGGGGGYSPPAFEPYSLPVHTINGNTIGSVEGKSFFDTQLSANSVTILGNNSYSISYKASLNSKPGVFWLNPAIEPASSNGLPEGMHDVLPLIVLNVTSNGLDIKGDTVQMLLAMPRAVLGSIETNTIFYLLRYDGGYQIQKLNLADDGSGTVSFSINPSSGNGFYTLVKTLPVATLTPTATPTPAPTPTPIPTPEPSGSMSIYIALLGMVVSAIMGAAVVFFIKK